MSCERIMSRALARAFAFLSPPKRDSTLTHTAICRWNPPCKRLLVVSDVGYYPYP